ncbi:1-acyl-sn-glycerol-3-phosphate acyltransferase gamma-like isoform X2 [Ptychodera flava]|uniref:1-acyl-sn-glycerol-3-phosphate acyltransferase gamma-like isoform X2 n=1 Tax=Ptychodera flava TaxID=63121 RepID=UPI00396A8197
MLQGFFRTILLCLGLFLFGYTFIVSGIIINLLQCCSLVIWPFHKNLYRRINCTLANQHWSQVVYLAEWFSGTDCIVYSDAALFDRHLGRESNLVILNHKHDIDWLLGWIVCQRYNVLGSSKVFAKNELRYVPFIGWSWVLLEMVFLKRDWTRDKPYLIKCLKILAEYPVHCWILLFCEGTRFTEEKKVKSNEIARQKGLPELKHHLLPRTKGFVVVMEAFKGKVPAIYDCTLGCSQEYAQPTLYNIVMGKKCLGHMLVRRIPINDISTASEEECAMECHKIYQYKDKAYEYFQKYQTFEGFDGGKYHGRKIPRTIKTLMIEIFWNIILCVPSFYYLGRLLINGPIWYSITLVVVIVLAILLIRAMIHVTDTKRGSKYGAVQNGEQKKQN